MTRYPIVFLLLLALLWLASCKQNDNTTTPPATEAPLFRQPANFPAPVYDFKDNKVTQAGFELGRKLFYDPALSKDSTVSCGTCHKQYGAFSDPSHNVSHGILGKFGTRNSPAIFNTAWWPSFFWDGGSTHIELQPIAPITNPVEMDETIAGVVEKLQRIPEYPPMFKAAFGKDTINTQAVMRAIAQFMGAMVSDQSKYDKVKRGEASFSANEAAGYTLFKTHCAACHTEPLFTDFSFRNNGLESVFSDEGRKRITQGNNDLGKFKVPTLRNISVTWPYMHDGRFYSLGEILEHYESGIKNSATLDNALKTPIQLTTDEKLKLVAFLETLTDPSFIADKRFSEPVK